MKKSRSSGLTAKARRKGLGDLCLISCSYHTSTAHNLLLTSGLRGEKSCLLSRGLVCQPKPAAVPLSLRILTPARSARLSCALSQG
ncbi:hypothetical protein KOW79_006984 [Hemibagrus wyckioides]|uniref:Uncharacterized protein n=1 Tax=Hemibagrus wyckioides TaxID=337641 RepID=A0A9D3NU99_9TELE|nr:hypothetical protein KOW79_006984 [Hemibagrus wyckioides]